MHYVCILYNQKDGQLYIGSTPDLKKRIVRHIRGFAPATKNRRPFLLVHYEAYLIESDAKRREKFLKGGTGRHELKIQVQDCFKKIGYK